MNIVQYVTKKGDTFDSIAYAVYGDEELIKPIIEANKKYVETAVFDYGIILEVPDIEKTDENTHIPPWRALDVNN